MKISVPVYVESHAGAYRVRPLFFPRAHGQAEVLGRAMARLENELRRVLDGAGGAPRLDALAACTFQPDLESHAVQVNVEVERRTLRLRLVVVTLEALGRRIAHVPAFPTLWFDVERGERLETRVEEMVSQHLRSAEDPVDLPEGRAWISSVDVSCPAPLEYAPKRETSLLASLLGEEGPPDGARELERVGRCLDRGFPDELERAVLRERDVARLLRAMDLHDRRPVLVRGPRRVGKTALVHEAVYRRVDASRAPGAPRRFPEVWLLAPGRLISGMMFVGQWEARLVAILDRAKEKNLVLYFDDLLGLFTAGRSASADLSVADVLKPYVERRDVRVLAEITPQAFRVLQERDRGLADMFEIVGLEETSPRDTLRVVLDVVRRAERRHATCFTPDGIGQLVDLQRRFVRDAAFPGKACVFAQHLAARLADGTVTRQAVLEEFHAVSGLSLQLLDTDRKLTRDDVLESLRRDVIGQEPALEAMADAVSVAKARLSDPTRPLAALLFLGPTGVGKTRCARALASFLFGDAARMVAFDMNEFITAQAVSRLVGTFEDPAGLLTSAVRQMPFCVLLLDEIEKAHPDVFNLLLQVLGDGRLTDALGRTVDFTHAIVIMTSNLGVREAGRPAGLRVDGGLHSLAYRRAAEQFFAPEFFNRLDRIVPFAPLSREDVSRIARLLMGSVLSREGLLRRQCILGVERGAFDAIVDAGFHPVLGARALKRAVERQVAQPIAARLAALPVGGITYIGLFREGEGVTAVVRPLRPAHPRPLLADIGAILARINGDLAAVEAALDGLAPDGPVDSEHLDVAQMKYFRLREDVGQVRRAVDALATRTAKRPGGPPRPRKSTGLQRRLLSTASTVEVLGDDVPRALRDAVDSAPAVEGSDGRPLPIVRAQAALRDTRLLRAVVEADAEEEALIWIRGLDDGSPAILDRLVQAYSEAALHWLDLEVERLETGSAAERALMVRGMASWRLLHAEQGTHLFFENGRLQPLAVGVQRVAPGASVASLEALRAGRRQWVAALGREQASVYEAPHPVGDVLRVYAEDMTLDLRSALAVRGGVDGAAMRELILGGLE